MLYWIFESHLNSLSVLRQCKAKLYTLGQYFRPKPHKNLFTIFILAAWEKLVDRIISIILSRLFFKYTNLKFIVKVLSSIIPYLDLY